MSLINDALKKAQRQRMEPSDMLAPMTDGGGGARKRGAPMPAQTIALIAGGCVGLVALSIGGTLWLLKGKTSGPATAPAAATAKIETPAPAPNVASVSTAAPAAAPAPTPTMPRVDPAPEKFTPITVAIPKSLPVEPKPEPESKPLVLAGTKPSTVVSEEATKPAAARSGPARLALPDERVHVFLDALRVGGIRSSGSDSRVLINDKVFRVNDIVERSLELRLTKVGTDSLTFTDANGVVYEKNF